MTSYAKIDPKTKQVVAFHDGPLLAVDLPDGTTVTGSLDGPPDRALIAKAGWVEVQEDTYTEPEGKKFSGWKHVVVGKQVKRQPIWEDTPPNPHDEIREQLEELNGRLAAEGMERAALLDEIRSTASLVRSSHEEALRRMDEVDARIDALDLESLSEAVRDLQNQVRGLM